GAGVGERVDGAGVLDDTADVVQRFLGQASVSVACEDVHAVLGDGLVNVHAGTVVANDRLGHEGSGLAVGVGNVVYAVLQDLHFVSLFHQGVGANTDFALAGSGDFVVVNFNVQAHLLHGSAHGGAQVVQGVYRGNREVAALDARTVTAVATVEIFVGNPCRFFREDFVHGGVHVDLPLDGVEDEKFRLRTEQGLVTDAGRLQVFFSATADGARVAVVTLHGGRLDDVAAHDNHRFISER